MTVAERIAAIAARAADCQTYNFGLRSADQLAHNDAPYLLDLARKQAAALDRVRALADDLDIVHESFPRSEGGVLARAHANRIRAAMGDGAYGDCELTP